MLKPKQALQEVDGISRDSCTADFFFRNYRSVRDFDQDRETHEGEM